MSLRALANETGLSAPFLSDLEQNRRCTDKMDELANALGVSRAFYSRLERGKRAWTLSIATSWLDYVLAELDKLDSEVVDFSKVLDFHDLNFLNDVINVNNWSWWEVIIP